uniref:WD repeat-containing protein 75 second beta-propeller domain-containing protein n=1 Tax=Lotharella globosa TaxID=91324 RepID=A0A7S4E0P5_9EUKA
MDEEKGKRKKKGMGGWIKRSMITKVTAMAVHPYHPYIATGNNKGRITIWYNVTGKDFATSSLHWHAHPVHAIAFSSDGSYMFSGGEEAVLVIWQLETKAKQFLPRLGSVIRSITISPDGNIYALALADNSLKFVDAVSNSESLHVKGLALAHSLPGEREQHGVGGVRETLKTDPRDSLIACRGVPGRLQFYDALWEGPGGARGRHANELHVTLRAMVSRTERVRTRQRVLTSAYRVDAFEFDHTGQWLATVESSTLELTSCDYKLKFWRRPPSSPNFILTSTVRDPHGSSRVLKLTFKPPSDHASGSLETMAPPPLCTLGADNKFKFWHGKWRAEGLSANPRNLDRKQQEREQSGEGDGVFEFSCKAQGDFKTSHKANTMAFSQDGTVMAIGYSQIVTLWDTETFTLAHVLSHGGPMERIRSMVFVSRYLISATSTRLLVWDTVSLTTVFSHNLNVISLAVSPAAGTVTSTGPRFVALIGSLHPKPRQPTKIGKQNNSKTIGSCAAVVEFDARDGSPLRTCLITDVRNQGGMCFVTPRGRGSKDGNKGKGGGVLWPVLVYINDLFELKTIEGFGGSSDETVGMPASEAELQENESETPLEHSLAATSAQPTSTIFSQIYGGSASSLVKEVEGRPVTNGVPSMDLEGESEKEERVKRLLDVPSHMLMRVHTLFTSFMQAVLPTRAKSMASGKIENQPLQRANRAGQENGNETESEKKLEGKDEAEKECRRVDALLSHNLDQELEWNADAYLRMLEDVHDQDSSKKEVKDARSNKINSPKKRKGSAGSQKSSSKKKSKKRKSK